MVLSAGAGLTLQSSGSGGSPTAQRQERGFCLQDEWAAAGRAGIHPGSPARHRGTSWAPQKVAQTRDVMPLPVIWPSVGPCAKLPTGLQVGQCLRPCAPGRGFPGDLWVASKVFFFLYGS